MSTSADKDNFATENVTFPDLPIMFFEKSDMKLSLTDQQQINYISSIFLTKEDVIRIERDTVKQSDCKLWFELRKGRITSSVCHRIFIRKRNFESLCENILNPTPLENLPSKTREVLNHGKLYESRARELYVDVMKHKLKKIIFVRETGVVIQPSLIWLAASPDGFAIDETSNVHVLIEIKCPASKKHSKPSDLLKDPNFYVGCENGIVFLKKAHSNEYYSQIQLAMGLSGVRFCDFVVYTFKGIIIRTEFNELYFDSLLNKLKPFYRDFMLPSITSNISS